MTRRLQWFPTAASLPATTADDDLSLFRLYLLRAIYLLIGIGEGSQVAPALFVHDPAARGVIPALLAGMCLLDLLGLKYPRQMLPLLLFELAWKYIWFVAFGLPQWFSGQQPPTFAEDFFNIGVRCSADAVRDSVGLRLAPLYEGASRTLALGHQHRVFRYRQQAGISRAYNAARGSRAATARSG